MNSGHEAHLAEEKARESGEFLEALKFADEATLLYEKEGNLVGLSEVQAARFEIFKHLYLETDDGNFLILGKMAAKAGVVIARKSEKPEALSIPLFAYAKALYLKGKYDKAIEIFKEALAALPNSRQNRPSVAADIRVHLALCEYVNGDETALSRAEEALLALNNTDEQKYEKDVWLSGGYLKLSEALAQKDRQKAYEYMSKAFEIIDANSELVLRKKQADKLRSKLNS